MSKNNKKSKPVAPNNNESMENAIPTGNGKVGPLNDIFYEEKSNPLSSKGN